MWYALICSDANNSLNKRKVNRPAHLKRVKALKEQGRILIAGPHPVIDSENPDQAGFSGSLLVAEFKTIEEAQSWIKSDPYYINGVFKDVIVKPFKVIFP